jgi:UDP-N-acetylmuramyl pentapeptide phosphotransferase/UDP-N-acetylglucosamine-1-phosphate transferase
MSLEDSTRFLAAAGVSACATAALAALAPRLGWTDAPTLARKTQRRAVPAVGGAALLFALLVVPRAWWSASQEALWGPWLPSASWRLATLLAVFVLGTLDDLWPLAAGPKALGQTLALTPLACGASSAAEPWAGLALLLIGLFALNLLNTFDNADGALASLCLVGFLPAAPLLGAALLGFLPFNLDAGRARHRSSAAPSAYLGDAGAFLLAALVLLVPASAGLLVLPALDLARLSLLRWSSGSRPWIGDREHLAHRLERRGLGRVAVALVLAGMGSPAAVLVSSALRQGSHAGAWIGCGATSGLFLAALWWTGAGRGGSVPVPCSPRDGSE